MRYAFVQNDIVSNIIVWDGVTEYDPGAQGLLVELGETEWCDIGYQYIADATPRFVAAGE